MVYDESSAYVDEFNQGAESSSVLYGPQISLSIDPANAARMFINTMDILQLLLTENDQSVPDATVDYTFIG